ncbi:PDR/VanB family oxidoreductase [Bradyrhizobium sp. LjRoot220]|uniref:PDR/VanB family oxidoreductase n=1 Tax=Bradyrhizobium sp. LjRoot220 TaxID=3342284 RepID=UPI003ECEC966
MDQFDLTVTDIHAETALIRSVKLARPHGEPLPSWEAGAHVKVRLPVGGERSYSLINTSLDPAATTRPHAYRLGVRMEQPSQGGSKFMHTLKVGDVLSVAAPQNNFPLEPTSKPIVLVAGGIGVTPMLSMAATLTASKHPYRFIYAGRSRDHLAFLGESETLCGEHLSIHTDDTGGVFDVKRLMISLTGDEPLYVCGPKPMIDAAIQSARDLGWPGGRLRFEIFTTPGPLAGDQPFEVVLNSSGKTFLIPPDKTILSVLIEAGEDPMHDCQRGDCGICQVGVVEGTPDHRDYILTDSEKAGGKVMQICVSRSKSPRLVLDL